MVKDVVEEISANPLGTEATRKQDEDKGLRSIGEGAGLYYSTRDPLPRDLDDVDPGTFSILGPEGVDRNSIDWHPANVVEQMGETTYLTYSRPNGERVVVRVPPLLV